MGTVCKATFIKPLPAAAYIRMSGRHQDKSLAEQRAEITKLAAREGCSIVECFTDEAITGDSSTSSRPGPTRAERKAKSWRKKRYRSRNTSTALSGCWRRLSF